MEKKHSNNKNNNSTHNTIHSLTGTGTFASLRMCSNPIYLCVDRRMFFTKLKGFAMNLKITVTKAHLIEILWNLFFHLNQQT